MAFTPDAKQIQFLWCLLLEHGGTAFCSEIPVRLGLRQAARRLTPGAHRAELETHGLISMQKERQKKVVEATEAAWEWLKQSPHVELPHRISPGYRSLQALLIRLQPYLAQRGDTFANIYANQSEPEPLVAEPTPELPSLSLEAIQARIKKVYWELAYGRSNVRIRIADLITHFSDVELARVKEALLSMELNRTLLLISGENPREITPADRQAAVIVGGTPTYFIRME